MNNNNFITDPQEIRNVFDRDEIQSDSAKLKENREKQIKYLIYLKGELIKQTKKEIKVLHQELDTMQGTKKLEKKRKIK